MDIDKRLREVREMLGYSQEEFGALAGVKKMAQYNYERGERQPDSDYLAAIAGHGADVLYILTGKRSVTVAEVALLPPDERGLVDSYRRCNAAAKKSLIQTAALLAMGGDAATPGIKMKAGNNSKQVGVINAKGDVTF